MCFPKTLMGPKGPCLLGRMNLKTGTNRPVQSQAVNWATAGLLVGPLACWWTWRMCVSLDTVESSNPNLKAAHAVHDDAGPGASTRRTQGNPASAAEDLKFDKLDIADAESPELFCPGFPGSLPSLTFEYPPSRGESPLCSQKRSARAFTLSGLYSVDSPTPPGPSESRSNPGSEALSWNLPLPVNTIIMKLRET
jgi:hypothetical protein